MKEPSESSLFPTFKRVATYPFRLVARRWRVIVGIVLVLAVITSIATATLGYKVSRELARIKAEGDPVEMTDLAGPPIPDSENGALIYEQAFQRIKPIENDPLFKQYSSEETRDSAVKDPKWWKDTWRLFMRYDNSYCRLVMQAQAKPKCRFKTNWEDGFGVEFPYIIRIRSMCRVLCLRSVLMAHEGKSAEAVDSLIAAIRLQDAVADGPTLIHQLVRAVEVFESTRAVAEVVGSCRLSDEQTRQIEQLLARVDLNPGFVAALKGERAFGIWAFREMRRNPATKGLLISDFAYAGWQRDVTWAYMNTIGRPILYADQLAYLRLMGKQVGWFSLPYREVTERANRFALEVEAVPRAFWVASILTPIFTGANIQRDGAIARTNGTRIILALYRYKQQRGNYPESLSALASCLKWFAPLDPFSGGPFNYKRQGKGFLLYSIGSNLKDDGGLDMSRRRGNQYHKGDIVWRG